MPAPSCFAPILAGVMLVGRKRSQGIAQRSSRVDAKLGKEPMQLKSDCPVREEQRPSTGAARRTGSDKVLALRYRSAGTEGPRQIPGHVGADIGGQGQAAAAVNTIWTQLSGTQQRADSTNGVPTPEDAMSSRFQQRWRRPRWVPRRLPPGAMRAGRAVRQTVRRAAGGPGGVRLRLTAPPLRSGSAGGGTPADACSRQP